MPADSASLRRFVARLHRRLVLLRILESAGIASLVGAGAGLITVGILLYNGRSAASPTLAFLALSIAAGLTWGWMRRPDPLQAAIEADRQLNLADLLSTALALLAGGRSAEPFEQTVLALAEERSRTARPSQVILNRLGVRSWSGIALASLLLVGLSLISLNPLDPQYASADPDGQASLLSKPQSRQAITSGVAAIADPIALDHPTGTSEDDPPDDTARGNAGKTAPGNGNNTQSTPGNSGAGAGSGQTHAHPDHDPATGTATSATGNDPHGAAAGGVGAATTSAAPGGSAASHSGGSARSAPVPVWQSSAWPQLTRQAQAAVSSGQVPPACRDLVRRYFQRE